MRIARIVLLAAFLLAACTSNNTTVIVSPSIPDASGAGISPIPVDATRICAEIIRVLQAVSKTADLPSSKLVGALQADMSQFAERVHGLTGDLAETDLDAAKAAEDIAGAAEQIANFHHQTASYHDLALLVKDFQTATLQFHDDYCRV